MASELLLIKSKMLLPRHEEEEEDPRQNLADRLIEYEKNQKKAKEKLEKCSFRGIFRFTSSPTLPEKENKPKRIEHIDIEKLTEAFMTVIEKTERKMPPPKEKFEGIVAHVTVSVEDKTAHYLKKHQKGRKAEVFEDMFDGIESRSEAVSAFLAILELMRSGVFSSYEEDGKLFIKRTEVDINTEEN
ncbi:MAG: segregation/condensation protein A [Clostridiales bacterium]|nr:MAG: segregation/condensation protein A [Clostridiales bacterium]